MAGAPPKPPGAPDWQQAAAILLEAGLQFLESLAPSKTAAGKATMETRSLEGALSTLIRRDPETQRPMLAVPLPEALTVERLSGAIGGLLSSFAARGK